MAFEREEQFMRYKKTALLFASILSLTSVSAGFADTLYVKVSAAAVQADQDAAKGDINADGAVSVADAQLALNAYVRIMAGRESGLTEPQTLAADISGDKSITVEDAQYLLMYYVKNTLSSTPTTWEELTGVISNNVSTAAYDRFSSIPDMHSISLEKEGRLTVDLIDSIKFTDNVTLTQANFNASNLGNYKTYLSASSIAKVSDPIRVRDAYDNMISDIQCTYGDNIQAANICFGFKADGTPDRVYKAADVSDGILELDNTTHYICIVKYSTVDLTLKSTIGKLDNINEIPHYEVGTGKTYSSLTSCLRALKDDSSEKVIDIYGGTYDILDEMGGSDFLSTLTGSEHWYDVCDIIPPNTTLLGHGNVIIKMEIPASTPNAIATLLSPINMQGTAALKNLTILGSNCRYCVHPEGSKFPEFDNAHWLIEDCYIEKTNTALGTDNAIACGLNNGVLFNIRNSVIKSSSTGAFSMHDNGNVFAESPRVFFEHCALISTAYSLIYSCTKRENMQTVINVMVNDCYLTNFTRKTAATAGTKDIYQVTYINSPHQTQNSANLIDLIPDTDYSN